jgi:transcriptional regulator with XRE-family HTH domain
MAERHLTPVYRRHRRKPLAERLWAKIDRSGGPDVCWPWTGFLPPPPHNYGKITIEFGRSPAIAPRVVWFLTHGLIPLGMNVLHHCDTPPCCNPTHLFLGTRKENAEDMMRKGRNMHITKPWTLARGPRHWRTAVTDSQIAEIRARYAAGGISQLELGREFGVSQAHISRIVLGVVPQQSNKRKIVTDAGVAEMRALHARGGISQAELARLFGVSQGQVSRMVHGLRRPVTS